MYDIRNLRRMWGAVLACSMFTVAVPASAGAGLKDYPDGVAAPSLWLDAAQISGLTNGAAVITWPDVSGGGNSARRTTGAPTYHEDVLHGKPVVRFPAGQASFAFPRMENIRTVFWVVRESVHKDDLAFLLGDTEAYDFHRGDNRALWSAQDTSPFILDGTTRLMGTAINGTTTPLPANEFKLISLVTSGDVRADTLAYDRDYGRMWQGDVAEVLIYSCALTEEEEH